MKKTLYRTHLFHAAAKASNCIDFEKYYAEFYSLAASCIRCYVCNRCFRETFLSLSFLYFFRITGWLFLKSESLPFLLLSFGLASFEVNKGSLRAGRLPKV